MAYVEEKSMTENMDSFHEIVLRSCDWVGVYTALLSFYEREPDVTLSENTLVSWSTLTDKRTWDINKDMMNIVDVFRKSILPNITRVEYEAYVLCRVFLAYMHENNISRLALLKNFKELPNLLKAVDELYKQKFNPIKIKILFSDLFYPDVKKQIANMNLEYDIINCIAQSLPDVPLNIKLKRLQQYASNMAALDIPHGHELYVRTIQSFKDKNYDSILSLDEFRDLSSQLNKLGLDPKHNTVSYLKGVYFDKNSCISHLINKINKYYLNILILVLFNQKEQNTTYHSSLYGDILNIYNGLQVH